MYDVILITEVEKISNV